MWTYSQCNGIIYDPAMVFAGKGYAGAGSGKNNPDQQDVHNVGPIPQGLYDIEGPPFIHPTAGPNTLRLIAREGTETYGRAGFMMHGDTTPSGFASEGCIVQNPDVRLKVWASGDRLLNVVAFVPATTA
jgi:hypothetical protein